MCVSLIGKATPRIYNRSNLVVRTFMEVDDMREDWADEGEFLKMMKRLNNSRYISDINNSNDFRPAQSLILPRPDTGDWTPSD